MFEAHDPTTWQGLFSLLALIFCFYFTLTFFQYVKNGDERLANQSKLAAVLSFALSLLIPAI
ncbi:hypothetical protein [Bacillus sp. KH172YL63]|uniref:hypothetical protein n=1 Tax=Bacillus sp. KH172YL63 TaxID=2709784 RepID=UPI0013E44B3A|nr:hypothetical protein [Bacillus sp. KH172YL63]BCB03978.1 hypothetical protein KH172YL63_21110 [Bacillus sp. KH172YL63]